MITAAVIIADFSQDVTDFSLWTATRCVLQVLDGPILLLREQLEAELPALLDRYVQVPAGWCPQA